MRDSRVMLILLGNVFLFLIIHQLNKILSSAHIHLALDGLYLIFPTLYLRLYSGLIVTFASGLFVYAGLPFSVEGCILYSSIFLLMAYYRQNIDRSNILQITFLAFLLNGIVFFAISLWQIPLANPGSYWQRLLVDLLFSQLVIVLVAAFLVEIQKRVLLYFGIDLAAELQSL